MSPRRFFEEPNSRLLNLVPFRPLSTSRQNCLHDKFVARIINYGGPMLTRLEAVAVFFGSVYGTAGLGNWQNDPELREQACGLLDFFRDITASSYLDRLAEYTPGGQPTISRGSLAGAAFVPFTAGKTYGSFLDNALTDADVRAMLQQAITDTVIPGLTPNRGYFVFLPPYIGVIHKGEVLPGSALGYHDSFQIAGTVVPYAVMTHPGGVASLPNMTVFEQLTYETSHEMVEMITDPTAQPGSGWYTGDGLEVADICLKFKDSQDIVRRWGVFHGYTLAAYWSEQNQACSVPPEDGAALPARRVVISRVVKSSCDLGVVENSACTFHADTSKLPGGPYTYQWSVVGATAGPKMDGPNLQVQSPVANSPFLLGVVVTDPNGCQVSGEGTFNPVSDKQAAFWQLLCKIRHHLLVNFRFDPLWDPLRDLTRAPVGQADVKRIANAVHMLSKMSAQLAELQRALDSNRE